MDIQDTHALIKIKNLKKRFGDNIVLDGVDLEIPKSSVFSILGTTREYVFGFKP
jgi:ABC-type transporter Mla maintaining outer membrane lipid asymmetry ATPase subunit MlaF